MAVPESMIFQGLRFCSFIQGLESSSLPLTKSQPQGSVPKLGAPGQAVTASLLLTFPETDNVALAGLVARIPGFDPGY